MQFSSSFSSAKNQSQPSIVFPNMSTVIDDILAAQKTAQEIKVSRLPLVSYDQLMVKIRDCWDTFLDHQQALLGQFHSQLQFSRKNDFIALFKVEVKKLEKLIVQVDQLQADLAVPYLPNIAQLNDLINEAKSLQRLFIRNSSPQSEQLQIIINQSTELLSIVDQYEQLRSLINEVKNLQGLVNQGYNYTLEPMQFQTLFTQAEQLQSSFRQGYNRQPRQLRDLIAQISRLPLPTIQGYNYKPQPLSSLGEIIDNIDSQANQLEALIFQNILVQARQLHDNVDQPIRFLINQAEQLQDISQAVIDMCCDSNQASKKQSITSTSQSLCVSPSTDISPRYSHPALQEVISDLFQKFADTRICSRPLPTTSTALTPPLAKWDNGDPNLGPRVWTAEDNRQAFNFKAAVVVMPAFLSQGGIAAWGALGHEVTGHEILRTHAGLIKELTSHITNKFSIQFSIDENRIAWIDYWNKRIDETASDILGILNMGPAAGLGLIAYLRSIRNDKMLSNQAVLNDNHPADLLRGFLAAETVRLLNFEKKEEWAKAIELEIEKDYLSSSYIELHKENGKNIGFDIKGIRLIVKEIANLIATTPCSTLGDKSLQQIYSWNEQDESKTKEFRELFSTDQLPQQIPGGRAAHVVAAAILESFQGNAHPMEYFRMMITTLRTMHLTNPLWQSCKSCAI